MCLITKQKEPIIITEDLMVYKILKTGDGDVRYSYYNYSEFRYDCNQLYTTKIETSDHLSFFDYTARSIVLEDCSSVFASCNDKSKKSFLSNNGFISYGQGFHFITDAGIKLRSPYKNNSYINKYKGNHLYPFRPVMCKCIIPRGAEVYYDQSGLGIASEIIVTDIIL